MKEPWITRKTKVVEAVQFINANFDVIEAFVGGDAEFRDGKLLVATPHGPLLARDGDWIIKEDDGEFVAYNSEIFMACYKLKRT